MDISIAPTETVSEAVLRGVSEFECRPVTELPPLYETIDPDALDTLCTSSSETLHSTALSVSFVYCNSRVVVDDAETIHLSMASPPHQLG